MTTKFAPDRWHDHRDNTAQYLRNRFGTPQAWFRRSCNAANAANMNPNPYLEERYITLAVVYPRSAVRSVAESIAAAPWAFVVYWPVANQRDLITVVGVSVEDTEAFIAQHTSQALAWYPVSRGQVYTYTPRPVENYQLEAAVDYQRRGPKGVDHSAVHSDLIAGELSVEAVCNKYGISRQTVSNIRKKFNTFIRKKSVRPRNRQNDTKGVSLTPEN